MQTRSAKRPYLGQILMKRHHAFRLIWTGGHLRQTNARELFDRRARTNMLSTILMTKSAALVHKWNTISADVIRTMWSRILPLICRRGCNILINCHKYLMAKKQLQNITICKFHFSSLHYSDVEQCSDN